MAQVSKLLDQEILEFANKELKKLGKNAYVIRKLQAIIAAHKHGIILKVITNQAGGWILMKYCDKMD